MADDRATLLALAARVEAAAGADRALAKDIARALGMAPTLGHPGNYGWREDDYGWWMATGEDARILPRRIDPGAWLTSLDAAAALAPEGWAWAIYGGTRDEGHATAYCVPNAGAVPWPDWIRDIDAATPALALCAAALRARAEEAGDE